MRIFAFLFTFFFLVITKNFFFFSRKKNNIRRFSLFCIKACNGVNQNIVQFFTSFLDEKNYERFAEASPARFFCKRTETRERGSGMAGNRGEPEQGSPRSSYLELILTNAIKTANNKSFDCLLVKRGEAFTRFFPFFLCFTQITSSRLKNFRTFSMADSFFSRQTDSVGSSEVLYRDCVNMTQSYV